MKDISWGVLPLVAGLFVLVEALDKTGLIDTITALAARWRATAAHPGPPGLSGIVDRARQQSHQQSAGRTDRRRAPCKPRKPASTSRARS